MFTHVEEGWHVTPIEVGQVIIASLHLELLTTEKFRVSGTIFYDACHDCGALESHGIGKHGGCGGWLPY